MAGRTISRELLHAMHAPAPASAEEIEALRRLVAIALSDTGQARKAASFLLAWWNAGTCGGFDLTDLWSVDTKIREDMNAVFAMIGRLQEYPPAVDPSMRYDFERLVRLWRPELDI